MDWSCAYVDESEERVRTNKVVSEVEDTMAGVSSPSEVKGGAEE